MHAGHACVAEKTIAPESTPRRLFSEDITARLGSPPPMRSILRGGVIAALAVAPALFASQADAFCGFYVGGADAKMFNDATVVVLMREGTRTVLSMQNSYKGPPDKFAMVVPVPVVLQKENVKTLDRKIFDHIDQLASPRLVEYWEQDPCPPEQRVYKGGGLPAPPAMAPAAVAAPAPARDLGVKIEAQFTVGEYQVVVLSAKDSGGLDTWLHREGYNIPEGGEPYFRPYVAAGSKFFVAKVDINKVKIEQGLAVLSPIRFHYDSEEFKLPVRLGLINSSGTQDLIVHVLGRGTRYDVANYPNVTIPTNLDVSELASEKFGTFYTSLFDRTMERNPKAVVTEYAWQPTSCDPCPGPVLDVSDLMTLGGDALPSSTPPTPVPASPSAPLKKMGNAGKPSPMDCSQPFTFDASGVKHFRPECLDGAGFGGSPPPQRPTFNPGFNDFVLTRLHVRYTKESLGEDLTFRAAPPIVGGRETRGGDGALEHGASPGSSNNFQARYAVRHPWTGPITCKEPKRGVWGGKPGTGYATAPPKAAQKLGFAPRGAASDLASFAKADIPEIGFLAAPGMAAAAVAAPVAAATTATPPEVGAGAMDTDAGASAGSAKKGCLGCAVTHGDETLGAWLAGLAALVVAARRRRRGSR